MPVSVVRAGEVPCHGTLVVARHSALGMLWAGSDAAHGAVWQEGRLKPPGCCFIPCKG